MYCLQFDNRSPKIPVMQRKTKEQLKPYFWAICELGQNEIPRSQQNPRIVFYHSFTSLKAETDEVPWCSSFMCAAHEESGVKSTKSAAANSWLTWGVKSDGTAGDIAVFTRDGGNHVAFVHNDVKSSDKYVMVLGGNQSNRVCVAYYPVDNLLGFRRQYY